MLEPEPFVRTMVAEMTGRQGTLPSREVRLPSAPRGGGELQLALRNRRSRRAYSREPLGLGELSQVLWSAQGITSAAGKRTAPSAGALYPLELHLLATHVMELPAGLYDYEPVEHALLRHCVQDCRSGLVAAAHQQDCVRTASAVLVIAAVFERTTQRYGERGMRYAHMEAGHVAQNVYLQAGALNLGTVLVGAFDDGEVKRVLQLAQGEEPLGLMPLGRL
jgi:SagB-type dehydrogenase family enzyme